MSFSNLMLLLLIFGYVAGVCVDMHGRTVSLGVPYIPGPDFCDICVCNNTKNEICKRLQCSPQKKIVRDCTLTQGVTACCDYVCMNDLDAAKATPDQSFLLSLCIVCICIVIVLIVGLKYRHSRSLSGTISNPNINGSDSNVDFISGSIGYLNFPHRNLQLAPIYKPPESYFSRGEAPPPYDEIYADSSVTTLISNQVTAVEMNELLGTTVVDRNAGSGQRAGESSNTSSSTSRRSSSHRTIPLSLRTSPGGVSSSRARSYTMENQSLDDQPLIHRSLPLSASLSSPLPSTSGQIDNTGPRSVPSRSVNNIPLTSTAAFKKERPFVSEDTNTNNPKPNVENAPSKTENIMLRINSDKSDESSDITPSVDDYHSECENCNINVNGTDCSNTDEYVEQETMTLQRNLHDCAHKHLSLEPLVQTLPTNTRTQRYQRNGKWKKPENLLSQMPELPVMENQSENT